MVAGLYRAISYDARPILFRAHARLPTRSIECDSSELACTMHTSPPWPALCQHVVPRYPQRRMERIRDAGALLWITLGTTPAPGRRQQVHAHARISVATYIHKCNRQLASSYRPPAIMGGTKTRASVHELRSDPCLPRALPITRARPGHAAARRVAVAPAPRPSLLATQLSLRRSDRTLHARTPASSLQADRGPPPALPTELCRPARPPASPVPTRRCQCRACSVSARLRRARRPHAECSASAVALRRTHGRARALTVSGVHARHGTANGE